MTRATNKMPTPEGIGAGQTATCRLPLGYTYNRLQIRMNAGAVPADVVEADWINNIGEIRLMKDGDAKITIDADDLVAMNKFYGQPSQDGILPIFLARPWARTMGGEDATGYGTNGGIQSLNLEMDLKPGITINELSVHAIQSEPTPWFGHLRIQKITRGIASAGVEEIADLPRGNFVALATHIKSNLITAVEVSRNGKVFQNTDAAVRNFNLKVSGRVPQAAFTHIDFLGENRVDEAVPMDALDFRIKATFSGAPGSTPIYVETLQSPFFA